MSGPVHTRTAAPAPPSHRSRQRPVSKPHDPAEREADRAAAVVARGGTVSGWSFSSMPESADPGIHRQETTAPKSDEEKYKEAATKAGEAALATPAGKALKEKVLADPVKAAKDAASSPGGIATIVGVGAAGVGALAATGKELPIQPPKIPLDFITPGLSAKVTWKGPVNAPTEGGLVLTFTEQGPKDKKKATDPKEAERSRIISEFQTIKANQRYAAGTKEAEEERQTQAAIAYVVAKNSRFPGLFIPFDATAKPGSAPPQEQPTGSEGTEEKKKPDETPVQREEASQGSGTTAASATAEVDGAIAGGGRPLDGSTRRFMESRFGVDFSNVRIHDDARAANAARDINAAAFTVGNDVVFGEARLDPNSPQGRHLLAHELSHVVQQSRTRSDVQPLQRRGAGEWLGIFFGTEEGNWSTDELLTYLHQITKTDEIDRAFDADNKARAIVERWKRSDAQFDLSPRQRVLLIEEMLHGPTLLGDETAIVDLLTLSEAIDLPAIIGPKGVTLDRIESDVDNDDPRQRLDTWVSSRFQGGRDAVLAGKITPKGPAVPAKAPSFGFSADGLDWRIDSSRTSEEIIDLIDGYSDAERTAALHHLTATRRPKLQAQAEAIAAEARAESEKTTPDQKKVDAIAERLKAHRVRQLRTEQILLHYFSEAVPATKEALKTGTSPTDPARKAEISEALSPPVRKTAAGTPEKFRATLPGETTTYEQKLTDLLPKIVSKAHTDLVAGKDEAVHDNKANVHTLKEFERIGRRAKDETDAVFGKFKKGPRFVAGKPGGPGNIRDQFAETERDVARMTDDDRKAFAKVLCFYFYKTNRQIRRMNYDHNAAPKFETVAGKLVPKNDEAKAQDRVADAFLGADVDNVTHCNEIDRNWPATAHPPTQQVFFQLFKEKDPEKDRLLLWNVFQTFIHEYLHTLVHKDYRIHARKLGSETAENTLMEGVDSLLTEIVWQSVEPKVADDDLRKAVEGPEASKPPLKNIPHPGLLQRYASYSEALALVDKVGIENVYAAYFLGLIDRIGGGP